MRPLIELFAQATTTTAASGGSGGALGLGISDYLAIPGAIVALGTILWAALRGVGVIRPLKIKLPRYWHEGGTTTRFSCVIRNRSFFQERTVTSLTLVKPPGWFKRTFTRWKKHPQHVTLLPWGLPPFPTLASRNEETIAGELRKGTTQGIYDPESDFRLLAHAGSKTSRPESLEKT
jgi:hypothetical protein